MQLDRDDLIAGLRDVVRQPHERNIKGVSIRIVGGAALRLAHFDRDTTADIDAQIQPIDELSPIILDIAKQRGWPEDWLNNKAVMFIPAWGRAVQWQPLLDDENVSISIAPLDALLAMKLNAARPGRDTDDIVKLLALNSIASVSEATDLFGAFYPGDDLPDRSLQLLERILELGLPEKPITPHPPDLSVS